MQKIPCLFQRDFTDRRHPILLEAVTPGLEWVLAGDGRPTRKWDGSACLVKEGRLYKRYDAKNGKAPPPDAIPCAPAPDLETGHWPHWIPVGDEPASKWHKNAWDNLPGPICDGTYELCGPHFAPHEEDLGNGLDFFIMHGADDIQAARGPQNFETLRLILTGLNIEGIVWWRDEEPRCKLRRGDYGLSWGGRK